MKDQNYDVIVVGFGNAAQTAAFAAYEAGAKVLVLEKAPESKRGAIRGSAIDLTEIPENGYMYSN